MSGNPDRASQELRWALGGRLLVACQGSNRPSDRTSRQRTSLASIMDPRPPTTPHPDTKTTTSPDDTLSSPFYVAPNRRLTLSSVNAPVNTNNWRSFTGAFDSHVAPTLSFVNDFLSTLVLMPRSPCIVLLSLKTIALLARTRRNYKTEQLLL